MTRAEFMGRLRRGLVGMPTAAAAEIASDYEMHFEDGAAAIGALTAIATILLVNATVWFARLHYRLLKPALENNQA